MDGPVEQLLSILFWVEKVEPASVDAGSGLPSANCHLRLGPAMQLDGH
jgi:hypothetical protein